ncbi:hypothetical protein [Gaopeijia maritima]
MKILTAVAASLMLAGGVAAPAAAQRNASFAGAVQRAEAADPGFLEELEAPLKQMADQMLRDVEVSEVSIDPRTGELTVKGTRRGTPVTLAGVDLGPNDPPPEFGWLVCAWNWFTSLGANGCADEQAEVAPTVETAWDRAQEAEKRRAFHEMTGGI